jgi:hypothetical protein
MSEQRDPVIRAAVVELASRSPRPPSWEDIERRAKGSTSPHAPVGRRGWAALAAAVSLVVIGVTAWWVGSSDDAVIADPTTVVTGSLLPGTSVPLTTVPSDATTRETEWIVEGFAAGLPDNAKVTGVAASGPIVWAVVDSGEALQMYRLVDGTWMASGDPLDADYETWIVSDGAGGVLVSIPSGDHVRIVRFDGTDWTGIDGGLAPDLTMSTVTSGHTDTDWIVGYDADARLVVIEIDRGTLVPHVADVPTSSGPSFITIATTVDVGPDGSVWAGLVEGAWRFSDGAFEFHPIEVDGEPLCCHAPLTVDANGDPWLFLGPAAHRLGADGWERMPDPLGAEPSLVVAPPDGSVWAFELGTEWRALRFDGARWSTPPSDPNVPAPETSASRTIRGLYGVIVATAVPADDGLGIHVFRHNGWQRVDLGLESAESADWARRGVSVSVGSIWVPTTGAVLWISPEPTGGPVGEVDASVHPICPAPVAIDGLDAPGWLVALHGAVSTLVDDTNALEQALAQTTDFTAGWHERSPMIEAIGMVDADLDSIQQVARDLGWVEIEPGYWEPPGDYPAPDDPLTHFQEMLGGVERYRLDILEGWFATEGAAVTEYAITGGPNGSPCAGAAGFAFFVDRMVELVG